MALWVAEQCTLIIFTSLLQWFPNPFLFPNYYLTFLFCCCCFSFSFHHLEHFLLPKYSWIHVYALKHGKLTRENWPHISQQLLIAHRSIACRSIISSPALFFILGFGFFFGLTLVFQAKVQLLWCLKILFPYSRLLPLVLILFLLAIWQWFLSPGKR